MRNIHTFTQAKTDRKEVTKVAPIFMIAKIVQSLSIGEVPKLIKIFSSVFQSRVITGTEMMRLIDNFSSKSVNQITKPATDLGNHWLGMTGLTWLDNQAKFYGLRLNRNLFSSKS